jgi:hypothetical protein
LNKIDHGLDTHSNRFKDFRESFDRMENATSSGMCILLTFSVVGVTDFSINDGGACLPVASRSEGDSEKITRFHPYFQFPIFGNL